MKGRRRYVVVAGAIVALAAGLAVMAQPTPASNDAGAPAGPQAGDQAPPGVPIIEVPPEPDTNAASEKRGKAAASNAVASNAAASNAAQAAGPPPPPAALPVRSPAAILQALDKVTAETIKFAVPIGQRVRYKNLVFQVKACETTGLGTALPRASAYVQIDSAPLASQGFAPQPPKQVFKGWMFANSPGLDPFQHPIYDAWLIACMAPAPSA